MEKETRIVIADDHPFVRKCFAKVISRHADVTFLEEADNGADLLESIEASVPDLAFIDLGMPKKDGYETISEIHARHPQVKIIVFSGYLTPENQRRAIALGAHSTISKTESTYAIGQAIKGIFDGQHFHSDVSHTVDVTPTRIRKSPELTTREQQIAKLVVTGKSSKEIACLLNISILTVDKHRANIKKKLGAKNVADMVGKLTDQ
jgi:DNA-binding NarL/FixJ family response regulator